MENSYIGNVSGKEVIDVLSAKPHPDLMTYKNRHELLIYKNQLKEYINPKKAKREAWFGPTEQRRPGIVDNTWFAMNIKVRQHLNRHPSGSFLSWNVVSQIHCIITLF